MAAETLSKFLLLFVVWVNPEFVCVVSHKPLFSVDDVIAKFGDNPSCYLTGQPIDISKPRTYSFDHIIPKSRGGDNSLDNLGLCTKAANQAKNDMTLDEFINSCKQVVKHNT